MVMSLYIIYFRNTVYWLRFYFLKKEGYDSMKKLRFLAIAMTFFLMGCTNASPTEERSTDQPLVNTPNEIERKDYGFSKFDLEIEVADDTMIEVEYDATESNFDAQFENYNDNIKLKDEAAMEQIDSFFNAISISQESEDEQLINAILHYFDIAHYTEFEVEVDFNDGTTKEIERKQ